MAKVVITIEDIGEDASKVGRVRVTMESDPPIPGTPLNATTAQIVAMRWLSYEVFKAGGLGSLEDLSIEKADMS